MQTWPGEAKSQVQGPQVHGNKGRRAAALPALSGCHCQVLPQPGGVWNTLFILPGAGGHQPSAPTLPLPACGPRHPVWYQTSVRSYMQTSSATQAEGLIIMRTTLGGGALDLLLSPWEMPGDQQPLFSACLNVGPREICLVFPRLPCSTPPGGPWWGKQPNQSTGHSSSFVSPAPGLLHSDPSHPEHTASPKCNASPG